MALPSFTFRATATCRWLSNAWAAWISFQRSACSVLGTLAPGCGAEVAHDRHQDDLGAPLRQQAVGLGGGRVHADGPPHAHAVEVEDGEVVAGGHAASHLHH